MLDFSRFVRDDAPAGTTPGERYATFPYNGVNLTETQPALPGVRAESRHMRLASSSQPARRRNLMP
ncbi:hypothetical protein ISE1_0540 [plant metagenome]|uniref:Uncharacterized protein n=1 Tax=plant metagenome TaxID=1297885 RepID=A0A484SWM7_9ZZZZ